MPKPFNIVSQEEHETLDLESDGIQIIDSQRGGGFCKYAYLSPTVKKIICGSMIALSIIIGRIAIAPNFSNTRGSGSGEWPPPEVYESDYDLDALITIHDPVSFKMSLQVNKKYLQKSKTTTTTTLDLGSTNFAETMAMEVMNKFNVEAWETKNENDGFSIDVIFDHVDVVTKDTTGDYTYYNSRTENGDTEFDTVLQSMVGESAQVYIDGRYIIVDEEDNENALEEMEQEYSIGTTTGLSAIDQVSQLTNLKAFLPSSSSTMYSPGDSWEVSFDSDVLFKGASKLLGFRRYSGVECAIIKGELDADTDSENKVGDDEFSSVEVEAGSVQSIIFWDFKNGIPRYAKSVITLMTTVESDLNYYMYDGNSTEQPNPDTDTITTVPMVESIEMFFSPA